MPKLTLLHHYLYPDDVVSARLFDDLGVGLVERGWEVTALPCNRGLRNEKLKFPLVEQWNGITFRRVWRPPAGQGSLGGQLVNTAWMLTRWSLETVRADTDVLIIGTNPVLSVLIAGFWKKIRPRVRLVHWCFDLYPEAAIADGLISGDGFFNSNLRPFLDRAYRDCDLIVDIGPCMRELINKYNHRTRQTTLPPWALYEPSSLVGADPEVRQSLFGNARLGVMYSGNFGRAHSFEDFLELARCLKGESIRFSFGIRGNAASRIRDAIEDQDGNVSITGFTAENQLAQRLLAPDIHLVSLKPEWTGTVVPSKFFGSIAVGRPVIFSGSRESSIARWIEEHRVGWVISDCRSLLGLAEELKEIARYPEKLSAIQERCLRVYQDHFSMNHGLLLWHQELQDLLGGSFAR